MVADRGFVQCPRDGQREWFDVPVRGAWMFCGFCGDRLAIPVGMREVGL